MLCCYLQSYMDETHQQLFSHISMVSGAKVGFNKQIQYNFISAISFLFFLSFSELIQQPLSPHNFRKSPISFDAGKEYLQRSLIPNLT